MTMANSIGICCDKNIASSLPSDYNKDIDEAKNRYCTGM